MSKVSTAERDAAAVAQIIAAGLNILRFARGGKDRFLEDLMVRSAIERQFELMGDAAARVSAAFREDHPQVPWRSLAGFRSVLIQGYEALDPEVVWDALGPPLQETLEALRRSQDT